MNLKIFLLCLYPLLIFSDEWVPHDHPAKLKRTIIGFTQPSEYLELKAEYPARLIEYELEEGQTLKGIQKKILIAKQDSKLIELELESALASLKSQEHNLKTQRAQVAVQKRAASYRNLEMERIRELTKEGKIAQASFDKAQFEYDQAQLNLIQQEQGVELQKQIIVENQVKVADVKERLHRHKIFGPKNWVLNEKYQEVGAWLNANDLICQLVNLQNLSIEFRLSDEEYQALKDKAIYLTIQNKKIPTQIVRTDHNYDPISRKRLVELSVKGSELSEASGGIEAQLELSISYPKPALLIPERFINLRLEQRWVVAKSGERFPITTLRKNKNMYVISKDSIPPGTVLILP